MDSSGGKQRWTAQVNRALYIFVFLGFFNLRQEERKQKKKEKKRRKEKWNRKTP